MQNKTKTSRNFKACFRNLNIFFSEFEVSNLYIYYYVNKNLIYNLYI